MPREPTSLLAASRLRVREDRLTDLLAVAAQRSVAFARRLLVVAGVDPSVARRVTRVRVLTQTWTAHGRRPDMELVGFEGDAPICRMWCENKLEALYQPDQLEDYGRDLVSLPGESHLLTIVTRIAQAPVGDWTATTWARVAAEAVGVLRSRLGVGWRRDTWLPEASADLLVLGELLEYLDKEHHIVSDPLTSTDVLVYASANRAAITIAALIARAGQLCDEPLDDGVVWSESDTAMWVTFKARDTDWWAQYDGYAEIHAADSDAGFGQQRRGEPAIGVGVTLDGAYGETIFSERTDWVAQLREFQLDPARDDDVLRIYRTVYLAEILIAGVTLEEQARWLADRMKAAMRDLRSVPPDAQLSLPQRRGARRRNEPSEAATSGEGLTRSGPRG